MTTQEQNKAFMRRFLAASVASDVTEFRDLIAADFVAHIPVGAVNREAFLQHNNAFVVAFSDRNFEAEELVAEGDTVVARATWRGVHSAEYQGLPPTGKQIAVEAIITERIKDGKSVEHRSLFDRLGMMQQLGLLPPPQPAR